MAVQGKGKKEKANTSDGRLAYADSFVAVDPAVATALGVDEALVIAVLWFVLNGPEAQLAQASDGSRWVMGPYWRLRETYLPYLTVRRVSDVMRRLEGLGVLVSAELSTNRYDHTKAYRINRDALDQAVLASDGARALLDDRAPRRAGPDARTYEICTAERCVTDGRVHGGRMSEGAGSERSYMDKEPQEGKEPQEAGAKIRIVGGL
jgi:hypothetical protein